MNKKNRTSSLKSKSNNKKKHNSNNKRNSKNKRKKSNTNNISNNPNKISSAANSQNDPFFLETDLHILDIEIVATLLSINSSLYFLKANLLGRSVIVEQLNNSEFEGVVDLDSLIDMGQNLLIVSLLLFAKAAFLRYEERKLDEKLYPDTALNSDFFRKIAISYIPTILSSEIRIKLRDDILKDATNLDEQIDAILGGADAEGI